MNKVVLIDAFPADQGEAELWAGLNACGPVVRFDRSLPESVRERCAEAEVVITNKVRFTEDDFAALPSLRYIGVCATGYDIIDTAAASARGIAVTNVPGYSTMAVAQATLALLLECTNATGVHERRVANGDWAACPDFCFLDRPITELDGATLVLVGAGAIGGAFGRIAAAMGMHVVAAQVPGRPASADRVPLAEALPLADVVSLHCPQTPQTAGLINASTLARCRDNLVLLNTARGGLIDETALASWLREHPQARAGIDVVTTEPPPKDHPLIGHPQVVVTPHIGWAGTKARTRLRNEVIANVLAWQNGERRNRVES